MCCIVVLGVALCMNRGYYGTSKEPEEVRAVASCVAFYLDALFVHVVCVAGLLLLLLVVGRSRGMASQSVGQQVQADRWLLPWWWGLPWEVELRALPGICRRDAGLA